MNALQPNWKDELKKYIKNRILFKSDEYYSDLILDDFKIVETRNLEFSFHKKEMERNGIDVNENATYYDLKFKVNSDSYKLWKLYLDKNGEIIKDDVLSLDIPQIVKDNFTEALDDVGVDGAMKKYNLFNRGMYRTISRYHHVPTLEKIIEILKEFETYRKNAVGVGFKFEEMLQAEEVKAFYFVRKSRVKKDKKNNDPACFDGNCLEKNILNGNIAIFGREVR
jgi:hypothetical protein